MTQIEQPELALSRAPRSITIPIEMIRAKKTAAAAFTLSCDTSGLEDKEIYLALGIDAGYFSNIKKGKATLQADLIARFCEVVGNTIYVEWLAYQVHCTLVVIKTEAERRAEAAEARARQAEQENRLLRDLLQGKVSA
ncbi:hypothetical protein [Methylibium sp. T29]|uniref:hypothetical protein n=1 Tax=Methylibium sp. T29 TaxID=1430884 RepID=UPI0003F42B0B|nr:hypothetical protein [Methylibium sp. T29]AIA99089.1 hypothetical protein T29Apl_00046 [Methylibium sp. T29]EWS53313.1 hypothetical protein X551_03886 [Methylibium sp. T29]